MPMIGVRELREQTAEVLRRLREGKVEYIITYQGRPVAVLLPLLEQQVEEAILQIGKQATAAGWEPYARLAETLRQEWPRGRSTQTVLDEIRES
ncbi:MAG: type II toxin-antitoxin system Phd/YefM family antitoxin [Anaerolineae bacterium]|nr:type II toxin-antitoxin system Phd/YefM family antitoxin [Anaerolineae bacterium]